MLPLRWGEGWGEGETLASTGRSLVFQDVRMSEAQASERERRTNTLKRNMEKPFQVQSRLGCSKASPP